MNRFILAIICSVAFFQLPALAIEPSYIAVEINSGKVLFSQEADVERPVSGLSQIATALVALDWVTRTQADLDTVITVPNEAYAIRGGNPMSLQPGDQLTLRDALYSSLLGSDNVSALSVAAFVGKDLSYRQGGGSAVGLFVKEMNNLARELKMLKTQFRTPHGLDSRDGPNVSCAVDMALLGWYAMQNPAFLFIVKQSGRSVHVKSMQSGEVTYNVQNTNPLLSLPGFDGIKTANSDTSGPCCVITAMRNALPLQDPGKTTRSIYPQRIVAVVLGTPDRYNVAKMLVTEGWKVWEEWFHQGMPNVNNKGFLSIQKAH